MTIEEIINKHCQRCNIPFDTIEALCKEVRRLTIEECKNKVNVIPIYPDGKFGIEIICEIDYDTFPTDLNNIEL